jgi:methionyl-tRNA synthetase
LEIKFSQQLKNFLHLCVVPALVVLMLQSSVMPVLQTETRQQVNLQRSIASELDWVNSNAKGQQKKGKARLRRYEDLAQQVWHLQPPLFPILLWLLDCSIPAFGPLG